jgi:hypothetical protein
MNKSGDAALNALCPYFTMFPLAFPHSILKRHAVAGQTVCDPFCGRGTTVLAARMLNLKAIGIDSNPLAAALTEAKLAHTTPQAIVEAMKSILEEVESPRSRPRGEFWTSAFHGDVLDVLCRLRQGLIENCATPARRALRAIILGALHGPKTKRFSTSSYFSNQCPRTYAPKPDYAVQFWRKRRMHARRVNVERIVSVRAERYYAGSAPLHRGGHAVKADVRQAGALGAFRGTIDWIITSPPYYGMRTYAPDQWLRLWFLGGPTRPNYVESEQLTHGSPEAFAQDLRSVWKNLANRASHKCKLVIRFGAINDRKLDPVELMRTSLRDSGWRIATIHAADRAPVGRRQSEHFGTRSEVLDEFDVWAARWQDS